MNLLEFVPQKNIKKLGTVTGALFVGAAVLMLFTYLKSDIAYRWAFQLIAIGMLCMGIFITTRYIMKSFVYAVLECEDGSRDFTVTEIQGRHKTTVCRIAMSSIEQIVVVPQNDKPAEQLIKNQIREQKRKKFNYCADLLADNYICLFSNEGGIPLAIKISWHETLESWFEG